MVNHLQKFLLIVLFLLCGAHAFAGELLSERTYRKLAEVQKLIEAGAEEKALSKLDRIAESLTGRGYEQAVVQQTYGYLYTETDQIDKATAAYENSIRENVLPAAVQQSVRLTLVQLYLQQDKSESARQHMETWLGLEKSPSPQILVLAAHIYLQQEVYARAIELLSKAISTDPAPQESWYQMLIGALLNSENYERAVVVLRQVLERYPANKQYWLQLASTYIALEKPRESLSTLTLAYQQGLLSSEKELLQLAQMYLYVDLPYQAAQLIDAEIGKQRIEASADNLGLLYRSYLAAREYERADQVMAQLLPINQDAALVYDAAMIKLELERWPEVISLLNGLKDKEFSAQGEVLLLLGIAYYETGDYEKARTQFIRAKQQERTRKRAGQWLKHLEIRGVTGS